jgi:hypothetical protein
MHRLFVIFAFFFVALIVASLWHGISNMHLAENATADGVATRLGK